jgi:hypothetical protein
MNRTRQSARGEDFDFEEENSSEAPEKRRNKIQTSKYRQNLIIIFRSFCQIYSSFGEIRAVKILSIFPKYFPEITPTAYGLYDWAPG